MEDYQKRLLNEYKELVERTDKLNAFIQSEKVESLPEGKRYLLYSQFSVMQSYRDILGMRLNLEGIDPNTEK